MAGPTILALAELSAGAPTRLSLELATLATELATASGGRTIVACVGHGAADGAKEVARYAPEVLAIEADTDGATPAALVIAAHLVDQLGSAPADLRARPGVRGRQGRGRHRRRSPRPAGPGQRGRGRLAGRRPGRRDEHFRWPAHHPQRLHAGWRHHRRAAGRDHGPRGRQRRHGLGRG